MFLGGGELGGTYGRYHSMVPQTFVSTKKIQKTPSDENCSLMFFFEQNATKNNNTLYLLHHRSNSDFSEKLVCAGINCDLCGDKSTHGMYGS
jgi:hypothetical protein